MTGNGTTNADLTAGDRDQGPSEVEPPVSPIVGDFIEEITRRLQAGEPVNAEEYIPLNPTYDRLIRRLLPALRIMVSMGTQLNQGRPHGKRERID